MTWTAVEDGLPRPGYLVWVASPAFETAMAGWLSLAGNWAIHNNDGKTLTRQRVTHFMEQNCTLPDLPELEEKE